MNLAHRVGKFLSRFRYPVSLPEDLSKALGVPFSNWLAFPQVLEQLRDPSLPPTRLFRYMMRAKAEAVFDNAVRREIFSRSALFSYYFPSGWLEFALQFDDQQRLRRAYVIHRELKEEVELPLSDEAALQDAL